MNLIIGLCFGLAAALALVVMWRMADRLRDELRARDEQPLEKVARERAERRNDPPGSNP